MKLKYCAHCYPEGLPMTMPTCDRCGNESSELRWPYPQYMRKSQLNGECPHCRGKLRGIVADFEANQRDAGVLDDGPDEDRRI